MHNSDLYWKGLTTLLFSRTQQFYFVASLLLPSFPITKLGSSSSRDKSPWKTFNINMLLSEMGGEVNSVFEDSFSVSSNST